MNYHNLRHLNKKKRQASNQLISRFSIIAFVLLLGMSAVIIFGYEKVITTDENGNPILTPKRQQQIQNRLKKNAEEAEQYVLRAITAGYRLCYLCKNGKVWLEKNEIAKIGVSTNGQNRYTVEYYEKHQVYYITEYRGDLTTAKNREIERLGTYPLLPENQNRIEKLLYPPLNSKLD